MSQPKKCRQFYTIGMNIFYDPMTRKDCINYSFNEVRYAECDINKFDIESTA